MNLFMQFLDVCSLRCALTRQRQALVLGLKAICQHKLHQLRVVEQSEDTTVLGNLCHICHRRLVPSTEQGLNRHSVRCLKQVFLYSFFWSDFCLRAHRKCVYQCPPAPKNGPNAPKAIIEILARASARLVCVGMFVCSANVTFSQVTS
jgi:hypothetical protein